MEVYVRDLAAGQTTRASVSATGGNISGSTDTDINPLLSADGRYVTFGADFGALSSDLVANDPSGGIQLYERDLQQGVTTLVSANQANSDGGTDNTHSEGVSQGPYLIDFGPVVMSADGRFVCFASDAPDLVANDYNAGPDIFVRDTQSQTTDLVSARRADSPNPFGSTTLGVSYQESVSTDGRYVAFTSSRPDLVPPFLSPLPVAHVYVRDLLTGKTALVDVNSAGTGPSNDGADDPVISGDGRFVLFRSDATDLGPTTSGQSQLYWRDLQQGITRLATINQSGIGTDGLVNSVYSVSADGRFVLFGSEDSTDLVPGVSLSNTNNEIYVRDMQTGITTLVSVAPDGATPADGTANSWEISGDGRFAVFSDSALNLLPGGVTNQGTTLPENVYVRDLQKGLTSLVTTNRNGTGDGNGGGRQVDSHAISNDGRFVIFNSGSTDLVSSDQKGAFTGEFGFPGVNLYVRDLQTGTTSLVTVSADGTSVPGLYGDNIATISGNGRYVAIESTAPNLVPGMTTSGDNVVVRDLQTGTTVLGSVNINGGGTDIANNTFNPPLLSDDGRFLIFTATASDLVPGDTAGQGLEQFYLRDLQSGTTVLLSRNFAGTGGGDNRVQSFDPDIDAPKISGSGDTITFVTAADDLLPHDFNSWLLVGSATGRGNVFAYTDIAPVPDAPLTAAAASVQAVEGSPFSGVVATFTDADPNGQLGDYSATIDWGDGTTTAGTILADSTIAGQWTVSGSHTYADEGPFPVSITITDSGGSTATALTILTEQPTNGRITYHFAVDTTRLQGSAGALAFQFNPGALPDAQSAGVTVSHFTLTGGSTTGSRTLAGGASGSLADAAQFQNSSPLNELTQALTYGTSLQFDVTFSGAALAQPGNGLFGSTFGLQLLGADGVTPQLTTDPSGAALTTDINPDGTATARDFPSTVGGTPAAGLPSAIDAPLTAGPGLNLSLTVGKPFTGQVASFADANPSSSAADFTAVIDWGDGTDSTGTITQNSDGSFSVAGTKTYTGAGSLAIAVTITDKGGAQAQAVSTATVTAALMTVTTSGATIQAIEGVTFTGVTATFLVAEPNPQPSSFSATIAWGDGTTSAGTIVIDKTGTLTVEGSTTYAEEGPYSVSVSVSEFGQIQATATNAATVADAPLKVSKTPVNATAGTSFTGTVASFTDADPAGLATDYTAVIHWGDNKTSTGAIVPDGGDPVVVGTHTYQLPGSYAISVQVTDSGGSSATAISSAQVTRISFARPIATMVSKVELIASDSPNDPGQDLVSQSLFVDQLYADLLGRAPDLPGLNHWVFLLEAGIPRAAVVASIWSSPEHYGLEVDQFYANFLHRSADAAGRANWVQALLAGESQTDVALAFLNSAEYRAGHQTDAAFIQGLYADVLNRGASSAEVTGWLGALQGGVSRASVALAFLTSQEAYRDTVDAYYAAFLQRRADVPGEQAWLALLASGQGTPALVGEMFLASDEYAAVAGPAPSNAGPGNG